MWLCSLKCARLFRFEIIMGIICEFVANFVNVYGSVLPKGLVIKGCYSDGIITPL